MDWRGRAAATGARAKRQGSRQAACAAQSVVLGRLSVKRISRSWAKREAEREGADKGRKQASKRWDVGRELEGTEYRERGVGGLQGRGLAVCVRVCVCSGAEAGLRVCGCACVKVVCLP